MKKQNNNRDAVPRFTHKPLAYEFLFNATQVKFWTEYVADWSSKARKLTIEVLDKHTYINIEIR